MKRLLVLPAWALVATGLAMAATPGVQLSAPVLGYVFDPTTQAIRQVTGVPGAASLDGVVTGSLKAAWVDSGAHLAIAVTKDDATAVVNWRGTEARLTALDTGLGSLKSASFSASGDVAVLSDGAAVEIWSGLASVPAKLATYAGEGGVAAAAARNNGSAAVATGDGNIVLVAGGSSHLIAAGGNWKALAFLSGGSDLLAASASSLVKLTGVDANPGQSTVASLDGEPSAMAVAADGTKAALAVGGDLLVVSMAGSSVSVQCGCETSNLSALAGNLVAHVAGTAVLDADVSEPRVFAVPEGGAE